MENTKEFQKADEIMQNLIQDGHVKLLRKDRGLIERTESSRMVITEDNRQVLGD